MTGEQPGLDDRRQESPRLRGGVRPLHWLLAREAIQERETMQKNDPTDEARDGVKQ